MCQDYRRGDIFYADLSPVIGSEQGGRRPVLILQNDVGNQHSPTTIVAAVTSKAATKAKLPVHVALPGGIGLEKDSIVLLEQVRTIDKARFDKYVGRLDDASMQKVDKSLSISVGLSKKIDWSTGIELCLCGKCASDFFNAPGHYIKRVDRNQQVKDTCTCSFSASSISRKTSILPLSWWTSSMSWA